jgi:hypothetical protein
MSKQNNVALQIRTYLVKNKLVSVIVSKFCVYVYLYKPVSRIVSNK